MSHFRMQNDFFCYCNTYQTTLFQDQQLWFLMQMECVHSDSCLIRLITGYKNIKRGHVFPDWTSYTTHLTTTGCTFSNTSCTSLWTLCIKVINSFDMKYLGSEFCLWIFNFSITCLTLPSEDRKKLRKTTEM